MYTTFHFSSAEELTEDVLNVIKATFKTKPITITVEEEMDTTAYLSSTEANRAMLKKSLEEAEKGNFIELKPEGL